MASDNEKARCKSKTRYQTEYDAKESIKRIQLKHGGGKSLRVYNCPVCTRYHITSSPKH
ncbi:MAG TPA: hypothetical protein VLG13_03465 [Patescibacteria group bacterium]|nr:hypothetical protein [Patescibacteria group bacterium]